MSLSNDFKGVWIPRGIIELNLTLVEKFILSIIGGMSSNGVCSASNGYIAKMVGLSNRSVQRIIMKLSDDGLVVRTSTKNGHTLSLEGTSSVTWGYDTSDVGVRHGRRRGTSSVTPPYIDVYKKEDKKDISLAVSDEKNTTLDFDTETIQEFKTKYPSVDVDDELETARLWLASTGKKYKNYKAFTHNWLRRKRNTPSIPSFAGNTSTANAMPTGKTLTMEEREDLAREKFLRIQNTPGVPA